MIHPYSIRHLLLAVGLGTTLTVAACGGTSNPDGGTTVVTYATVQTSLQANCASSSACHAAGHVVKNAPGLTIDSTLTAAANCAVVTKLVTANSPSTSRLVTVPRDGIDGTTPHSAGKLTVAADGSATRTATWDVWINAGASCQ